MMLGRLLDVPNAVIDEIEADRVKVSEKCYRKCSLRSYHGLTHDFAMLTSNCFQRSIEWRSCLTSIMF